MSIAVDHGRDHDLTTEGMQGACGWALHLLSTERHRVTGLPLPHLDWNISSTQPRLVGRALATPCGDAEAVAEWAAHLGLSVTEQRRGGEVYIAAEGFAHGAPVRIWTAMKTRRVLPGWDLMLPGEVAAVFAVATAAVTRWADDGLLGCVRTDGLHRRFARHTVAAFFPGGEIVPVLTVEQAASVLNVTPARVRRWGRSERLKAIRTPGGHRRFVMAEVYALETELAAERALGGAQ